MKITRELTDNGKKIIHVRYTKKELKELKRIRKEKANHNTEENTGK